MSEIQNILISASAIIAAIGLAVAWIYKKISIGRQVAVDTAVREERLKPIDAAITSTKNEALNVQSKTENYEHDYGVKLVHPTDDGSGTKQ